mmetsp:Transcript_3911/g.7021  ORF Transcript_3911/g.7021 Transcript_3911/m.7021 type:complete len:139 (+) Transcript_3911:352-768(+)
MLPGNTNISAPSKGAPMKPREEESAKGTEQRQKSAIKMDVQHKPKREESVSDTALILKSVHTKDVPMKSRGKMECVKCMEPSLRSATTKDARKKNTKEDCVRTMVRIIGGESVNGMGKRSKSAAITDALILSPKEMSV